MKAKNRIAVLIVATVVVAGGLVATLLVPSKKQLLPAPVTQTVEDLQELVKTDQFKNLKPTEQRRYFRRVMHQTATRRAKKYFELAGEERTKYLDETIDQMQKHRKDFRSLRGRFFSQRNESNNPQGQSLSEDRRTTRDRSRRRPRRRAQGLRARQESIDPATRAQMSKFRRDLRKRMKERGIQPWGRF